MRLRTTAFVLALALLLAAGASATPATCCASSGPMPRSVRAADCCETMLACPAPPQEGLAPTDRAAPTLSAEASLRADSPAVAPTAPRPALSRSPLEAFADGPPLYRLHAQLLI